MRARTARSFAPPLLALLALLALTCAPSASADVAGGASGSFGASEARRAARASLVRVGDAGSSARITATPGEPFARAEAVEVRGFSRLTQPHKAFHHVTLEVFDDARSSFARNECELRLADGRPLRARRGPGWPRKRDIALKYLTAASAGERTESDATLAFANGPALVVHLGPFAKASVVASCGSVGASDGRRVANASPNAFAVTLRLVAEDSEVVTRRWRFILGAALVLFAPRLADVAVAYYLAGAALGAAALAFYFVAKAARAVPGGRAARAGAGVAAAVSAFVVPPEHVSKVFEAYLSLWLAPARLALAAASGERAGVRVPDARDAVSASPPASDFAALACATLCAAVALAGAGAGVWATRAWVIETRTGEVAKPVASFARVAARALGGVLLRFCTLDPAFGGALASLALAAAVAEHARAAAATATLVFRSPRGAGGRRSDGAGRRGRARDVDATEGDASDDASDDAFENAFENAATRTPRWRGSRGRSSGSDDRGSRGGLRRRGRAARESDWFARGGDEDGGDVARPRGAASPGRTRSPGWSWFGGAARARRGGRRGTAGTWTPTTLDPEPRTPPAALVGTGAGPSDASPDRTRRAGSRRLAASRAFSFGARAPIRDADAEDDADGDAPRAGTGGAGRRGPKNGTRGGSGANPAPVGAAAHARGRFMTRAEFDALGAESTDRGLEELCGTPEFAKWMAKRSRRVRLVAADLDGDEA